MFLLDQSRSLDVSVHPGKQELDVTSMMVDRNKNKNSFFFLIKKHQIIIVLNSKRYIARVLFQDIENTVTTPLSVEIMLRVTQLIRPCYVFVDLDTRVLPAQ